MIGTALGDTSASGNPHLTQSDKDVNEHLSEFVEVRGIARNEDKIGAIIELDNVSIAVQGFLWPTKYLGHRMSVYGQMCDLTEDIRRLRDVNQIPDQRRAVPPFPENHPRYVINVIWWAKMDAKKREWCSAHKIPIVEITDSDSIEKYRDRQVVAMGKASKKESGYGYLEFDDLEIVVHPACVGKWPQEQEGKLVAVLGVLEIQDPLEPKNNKGEDPISLEWDDPSQVAVGFQRTVYRLVPMYGPIE